MVGWAIGIMLVASFVVIGAERTAFADYGITQKKGFDACSAPTSSQMDTWWSSSPYWNVGIYFGGSTRSCSQPNLTSSWISHQHNAGWDFLPLWAGPQLPYTSCATTGGPYSSNISLNTSTAYNQGITEAQKAIPAAANLGFSTSGMPIIYDLEAYNGASSCRAAAKAFINGWDYWLKLSPAQKAGVYGSTCASYLDDFSHIATVPDFIWFAWPNGNPSVKSITCISTSHWVSSQRHKQYTSTHTETWPTSGVKLSIDNDCSNGPAYNWTYIDSYSPCL